MLRHLKEYKRVRYSSFSCISIMNNHTEVKKPKTEFESMVEIKILDRKIGKAHWCSESPLAVCS
jgi:hypothetical protein